MTTFLFKIFLISFTGTVISMAGSKDLWRGQLDKQNFRRYWCNRPGFCQICKAWSEDPNKTARLWYQRDGIVSIRASIVSLWRIIYDALFMIHSPVQICFKGLTLKNCCEIDSWNVVCPSRPLDQKLSDHELTLAFV